MSQTQLVVLGASGNALDALDALQAEHEVVGFFDDDETRQGQSIEGIPILSRTALTKFPQAQAVALIGSEKSFAKRQQIIDGFGIATGRFSTILHPRAYVSRQAVLGNGVVVLPGVVIPSNARIGNHVLILPNTVIHHDSVVEDYSIIGAGVIIAGHVHIGASCYVGSGSTIKNNVTIGPRSLVGMGANVTKSFGNEMVLVGNPAREMKRGEEKVEPPPPPV